MRDKLIPSSIVLDVGCGCGYGTYILAERAKWVVGCDLDVDAITWAREHFRQPNTNFLVHGAFEFLAAVENYTKKVGNPISNVYFTDAVAFEVLEHMPEDDARTLLGALGERRSIERLYASTPNEETYPFEKTRPLGHVKHYRPGEFIRLLHAYGWRVENLYTQHKRSSEIMAGGNGRYLLAECQRA